MTPIAPRFAPLDAPVATRIAADPADASAQVAAATPATATDTVDPATRAAATKAAEQFEGLFVNEMLKHMREATKEISDDASPSRDPVNDDMLSYADTLLADSLAGRHAFGIADSLLRTLLPPGAPPAVDHALKSRPVPVASPDRANPTLTTTPSDAP
jgi:flagellar protein FlgJ